MTDTLTKPCTELFKVEAAWEWKPSSHEDLGLYKGDILSVFEKINEHWARGRNIKTDRRGRFPFNYTRPIIENPLEGTINEEDISKALVLHQPPAETTNTTLQVTSSSQELQPYTPPAQPAPWNSAPQLNQALYQMLTSAVNTQPQSLVPQLLQSTYPVNPYESSNTQPQFQQWPGPSMNISAGGAPVIIGSNNILGNQYQADASTYSKHDGYRSVSYSHRNHEHHDRSDHRREFNDDHRSYENKQHRSYSDNHRSYSDNHRENHEHRRSNSYSYDNHRENHDNHRERHENRRSNSYSHHGDHVDQGDRSYGDRKPGRRGGGRQKRYSD